MVPLRQAGSHGSWAVGLHRMAPRHAPVCAVSGLERRLRTWSERTRDVHRKHCDCPVAHGSTCPSGARQQARHDTQTHAARHSPHARGTARHDTHATRACGTTRTVLRTRKHVRAGTYINHATLCTHSFTRSLKLTFNTATHTPVLKPWHTTTPTHLTHAAAARPRGSSFYPSICSSRYSRSSGTLMRRCSVESRSRSVTVSSSRVSKSTVMQKGVPTSSILR
jgi:hypothetical protein